MTFFRDKQIKGYLLFVFSCLALALGGMLWFCHNQVSAAKAMYLEHDMAVASALLEQGVSEEIVAAAVSGTTITNVGRELLNRIGMRKDTLGSMLPFLSQFQSDTFRSIVTIAVFFIVVLCGGTLCFLGTRSRLYTQAQSIVNSYIKNDYSRHLPQNGEGEIYRLFTSVEQLATMLQSKTETEGRAKEFLKHTISDISHQLKTPLAALTMYQEIIENEPDNAEIVKEFSKKSDTALKRIEQLIQSMLKITRLDTGSIVFEKRLCLVSEVIKNAVNELTVRAECEKKQIMIEGNAEQTLLCDREWTSEAIGNLIKNALDHTAAGGIIHISWENAPDMLRIYISDNGSGIAPEDIYHIFKRFYRSKHSLDTQGIGLGLPLAKSIVEGQGGQIFVQSTLQEGTVFTLSFLTKP